MSKLFSRKRFWASLWLAQFCAFYLVSKTETGVFFFERLFSLSQNFRIKLVKYIFISLGDIFYLTVSILSILFIFYLFKKNNVNRNLKYILIFINVIYFVYQASWGMLYFQKPLLNRSKIKPINTEILKPLAEYYLNECIKLRKQMHGEIFKIESLSKIKKEIKFQQKNIAKKYNKGNNIDITLKPSIYSLPMSFTGILGYYNPFTSESQYNSHAPDTEIPFTLAHESAHQIGFAREEEANFIAYLIGENTLDNDIKYSVYWFTLKNILYNIAKKDLEYSRNFLKNLPEEILNDYKEERKFRKEHQGKLNEFFSFTNNIFLKSNRQEGSITYNYFIYLLLDHLEEKRL